MVDERELTGLGESQQIESGMRSSGGEVRSETIGEKVGLTHPVAVFFHLFFKVSALVFYLIVGRLFIDQFIMVFVITVMLLAFDFWTVKNVTGRLLVGLRWWNEIKEDGTNEWVFESLEGQRRVHKTESYIFWGTLFLAPLIWGLLSFAYLITFAWGNLCLSAVAVAFYSSNAIGYVKCAREAKSQLTALVTGWATQKAVEHIQERLNEPPASSSASSQTRV